MKETGCTRRIVSLFAKCLLLLPQFVSAQVDTLSFLHVTDLHLIFGIERYQPDFVQKRKHFANGVKPFSDFITNKPGETKSTFIVATGDLVDFFEAESIGGSTIDFQAEQFERLVHKSQHPVFLTLGNHDITSYDWRDTTVVSNQNGAGSARAAWIRNIPCFRKGTYYSRIFRVDKTVYRLIFLDDAYNSIRQDEKITIPYIGREQLRWLESQINQLPDDVEIILMHLPFPSGAGLPGYVNDLFSLLEKNHSVKLVLAGHNHRNAIKDFSSAGTGKFTMVQTGSFGYGPENWRQISLTGDKILISVPGKTLTEKTIPVN